MTRRIFRTFLTAICQHRSPERLTCLAFLCAAAPGKIRHEFADAKLPGLAFIAWKHPVDERSKLGRCDRNGISTPVRKTRAGRVAVLDRRKHGPEE
jgi:hypothetical protein